jgi:hypothetical protein
VVVGFGGAVVVVFADGVVIVTLVAAFGVEGAGVVLVVVAFLGFGGAVVVAIAGGGLVVAFCVGEATGKSRTALPAAPMSTMPSDTATDVPRDAIDMPSPAGSTRLPTFVHVPPLSLYSYKKPAPLEP